MINDKEKIMSEQDLVFRLRKRAGIQNEKNNIN